MPVDLAETRDLLVSYGDDQFDRAFARAKDPVDWDDQGREILDFTSGQMCSTIGHNHPALIGSMQKAGETAVHMFSGMIPNRYWNSPSSFRTGCRSR